MKIVNLDVYRRERTIKLLELKMAELALQPQTSPRQIKDCFQEWLLKTGSEK